MVALVTGAGRRLGRRIALSLATVGFDIVVHYQTSEQGAQETSILVEQLGRKVLPLRADIGSLNDVESLVEKSWNSFRQLDVLVNNAGVFSRSSWESLDVGLWQRMIQTNLTGTFLMSQAVARRMKLVGRGRIINIASIGGLQAWPQHIPYSVSKSGVIALTKVFARALAPDIVVNAIAPGTVILEGEEDPKVAHIPTDRIPLGRYGTPKDIMDAVVFLATGARYVTGQVFALDGGRSLDLLTT